MKAVYIGLDVGTSGCKAALVDRNGKILAIARREYGFESPEPGMVELNPATVWNAVKETLAEAVSPEVEIRMLAVSSIGEAVVMVDKDGGVLRNGITYLDQRGPETTEYIRGRMNDRYLHGLTGVPVNPMYTLNRCIWLKEHQPEIVEKTAHYFMFGDYITYMLTGQKVIDQSSASRTMLFDAGNLDWSREIGEKFGVPVEKFSPVAFTGATVGKIRKELAEETGLPYDLKIVLGCHDQCSALLGSGAVNPGDIMAGEGSTESINLIIHKENFNDSFYENQLCFEPYIQPGQYIIPVGQLSHGTSIRWFVSEFGADFKAGKSGLSSGTGGGKEVPVKPKSAGKSIYDLANENCAPDSGDVYFLPYLSRVKSMDASNQALGVFLGLDVNTGRAQMYRALLEGLCFESRTCFDTLQKVRLPIHKIVASGGCSKSPLFMQMKADVLRRPIHILDNPDAGITGLAMICAVADGAYKNYEEAAEVFVRTAREYVLENDYQEKYEKYCLIRETVKELYQTL
ncbi:hypothetical protein LQE92_04555 [Lacrimispora sp. NSJ-141]|uniref:Uncharacterized protein n=1 Tax=Lientehia hominis TaxID=2897778 RepID=A0AAP2RH71_9FIRM|nr:FGGY family carbohydrate kinase [Lientehia hominis]MCD2491896.1 hypothetical protein [Lientehia hominis]